MYYLLIGWFSYFKTKSNRNVMEFANSWLPSANPKISKRFKHQHNKIDERKHLQLAKKRWWHWKSAFWQIRPSFFLFYILCKNSIHSQSLFFFDTLNANLKFDTFYALFILWYPCFTMLNLKKAESAIYLNHA